MSKNDAVEKPMETPQQDVATEVSMSIDEFCTRQSMQDNRVELIGAFHFSEKRAGHTKDVESAYRARFDEFVNKPV